MKLNLLTIILLLTATIYAQKDRIVTCQTPSKSEYDSDLYFKKNKVSLEQTSRTNTGVNTRAYTQSIHNVIAKWDNGSYSSFRIGTAPNMGNIRHGEGLNARAKHTRGQSYEELRISALNNDLGPTIFNVGDTFYITLDSGLSSEWVSPPLKFQWEDLGHSTNTLSIKVETNYGVNGNGPYTISQKNKMMEFYDLVNPIIKEVYGAPSRDHDVFVVNDGLSIETNVFFNGPNQINSTFELNGTDLSQPRLMIHELVHAYRDNVTLTSNNQWRYDTTLSGFEEGMAEAVAIIVMDIFIERYPNFFNGDDFKIHWSHARGMPFDWDYDFQNHSQLTTTDFFSSDIGTGVHLERYGTSQTAMQKMYIEDPNVFKKFNAKYYNLLNEDHNLVPTRALVLDIFKSIIDDVERTPIEEWINDQRVFDCEVVPGNKVHMLTFHKASPPRIQQLDNRIHIVQTQDLPDGNEWSWNEIDPIVRENSKRWFVQTNNINGLLEIFNYNNSLHQSINIKNNKRSLREGGPEWLGPYQGPNNLVYDGEFTGNDGRDDCTQPGCGKRPIGIDNHNFISTSTNDRNHFDLPNNLPEPDTQIVSGLSELGLYKYQINFENSNYVGTYYRVHGQELVSNNGIFGGIKSKDDSKLIKGKLIIEHEDFGEETDIPIRNGAFISQREWTSVPETQPYRQGGRNDRKYSMPGKTHVIYISEDCTERKIDFRNIQYGDGLSGSQLFLFTVEDFENIVFTVNDILACATDSIFFEVTNNFPDILDRDNRISYKWLNSDGIEIATDPNFIIANSVREIHQGTYTLEISFFGCIITKYVNVTINQNDFNLDIPSIINLCKEQSLEIEAPEYNDAIYNWTGPNGFIANTRQIVINNVDSSQQGDYTVSVTVSNCNGTPITKSNTTSVIINANLDFTIATNNIVVCEGNSALLTVTEIDDANYSWTGPNGFNSSLREVNLQNISLIQQGIYIVDVTKINCDGSLFTKTSSLEISVEVIPTITFDSVPDQISVCIGSNIIQEAPEYNDAIYNWTGPNNFTSTNQRLEITNFNESHIGLYKLTVIINTCIGAVKATHNLNISHCDEGLVIPKFFTPNGDGSNDLWKVNQTSIRYNHIYIYNRYGILLKQLGTFNNGWNGYFNGKRLKPDDYWFVIHLQNNKIVRGHFSLIL